MYRTMNEKINMEQSSTTLDVIGTRGGGAKERGNIITSIMRWQQPVPSATPKHSTCLFMDPEAHHTP